MSAGLPLLRHRRGDARRSALHRSALTSPALQELLSSAVDKGHGIFIPTFARVYAPEAWHLLLLQTCSSVDPLRHCCVDEVEAASAGHRTGIPRQLVSTLQHYSWENMLVNVHDA